MELNGREESPVWSGVTLPPGDTLQCPPAVLGLRDLQLWFSRSLFFTGEKRCRRGSLQLGPLLTSLLVTHVGKRCPTWAGPASVTAGQMTPILGTLAVPALMVSGSTLLCHPLPGREKVLWPQQDILPGRQPLQRHCPLRVYLLSPSLLPCGHLSPSCSGGCATSSLALGLQRPGVASLISPLALRIEMLLPILKSLKFLKICK